MSSILCKKRIVCFALWRESGLLGRKKEFFLGVGGEEDSQFVWQTD